MKVKVTWKDSNRIPQSTFFSCERFDRGNGKGDDSLILYEKAREEFYKDKKITIENIVAVIPFENILYYNIHYY